MKKRNIDAYICPSSDPHNSEYVADLWKSREWISGFDGSAGVAIITQDYAGLWTDSRYFLQGEKQTADSEFVLNKVYNQFAPMHIDFLNKTLAPGATIGFDGYCMPLNTVKKIKKVSKSKDFKIEAKYDLMADVWTDRPEIPTDKIFVHDMKYAGKSAIEKISEIQEIMKEKGAACHLVTTLDDIAWIFNIRGKDVESNPVAIAYAIIFPDTANLYINPQKLTPETADYLQSQKVTVKDYKSIIADLNAKDENKTCLFDPNNCSYTIYKAINGQKIEGKTISRALKAVKNSTEIEHIRNCMVKDGRALVKAFRWLETTIEKEEVTECVFSAKLGEFRSTQDSYIGESFSPIVGYNGNGAIIHYRPIPGDCDSIKNNGYLLCDSGGQYLDGTTDITRTFCFGESSDEYKKQYTYVLQGMIQLTKAKFPVGTSGGQLDILARQPLWNKGLNFLHGTGHGVGFFLNVHEAPQGFAPGINDRSMTKHEPGMVTSNEPGYYREGHYGIRIENVILTVESEHDGFLEYETLTVYPIETTHIDMGLLSSDEKQWINNYHTWVYDQLSRGLSTEENEWLSKKCQAI
jgi:Xaa-Pro aminopeptidase